MKPVKLSFIAQACGAPLKNSYHQIKVTGISTDTRSIKTGDLFIPLIGEKFDGHQYLQTAAEKGAAAVLSSRQVSPLTIPILEVPDTLQALQSIAAAYRRMFPEIPVIGITGSVGKTSTKEMIYSAISGYFHTLKTEGNLNNEIGVPHTLFGIGDDTRAAVVEMGMNHFGEMHRLSAMVQPNIAVITCIGINHIEFLGSREGITKAKLEILDYMKPDAVLILNGDEPLLNNPKTAQYRCLRFGFADTNDYYPVSHTVSGNRQQVEVCTPQGNMEIEIPVLGNHHIMNAMAAIAVGQTLNIPQNVIRDGIAAYQSTGRRQRICEILGRIIIDDSYNAAPDSMKAGLSVLEQMSGKRKFAVLGDMLELGEKSKEAHLEIGKLSAEKCEKVFCLGEEAKEYLHGAETMGKTNVKHFDSHEEIADALLKETEPGDVILLKGSRGMKMETVLTYLEKESR